MGKNLNGMVDSAFEFLKTRVGNQPRDGITIRVGWDAIDILRAEDLERSIETFGLSSICYVILGANQEGDVILGHYVPNVSRETALQLAKSLVEQQNPTRTNRKLDINSFNFKFITASEASGELGSGSRNIKYDWESGSIVYSR